MHGESNIVYYQIPRDDVHNIPAFVVGRTQDQMDRNDPLYSI